MLLIAVIVFLHWLFTVYRDVGTKTKRAGLCSSLYIIYILFIYNKITSCAMMKRTNEIYYFLSLALLFLSCFPWSLVFLVVLLLSPPCGYRIGTASFLSKGRTGSLPHRSPIWLSGWHAYSDREPRGSNGLMLHSVVFSSGRASGFFLLGFCSPARDVTESVAVQRILCQNSLLLWNVACAGPKCCWRRTDKWPGERALALFL